MKERTSSALFYLVVTICLASKVRLFLKAVEQG